jgi:hypothetical protein
VRVSPNELIFSGAKAWDDIYGNKVSSNLAFRTSRMIRTRMLTMHSRAKVTWTSLP